MSGARIHGPEAAVGGDVEDVDDGSVLGPCPSCAAEIRVGVARNPYSGQIESAMLHPVPFCSYFGKTPPEEIERAITEKKTHGR